MSDFPTPDDIQKFPVVSLTDGRSMVRMDLLAEAEKHGIPLDDEPLYLHLKSMLSGLDKAVRVRGDEPTQARLHEIRLHLNLKGIDGMKLPYLSGGSDGGYIAEMLSVDPDMPKDFFDMPAEKAILPAAWAERFPMPYKELRIAGKPESVVRVIDPQTLG